ncbi:hypothetical protein GCM10010218_15320 [Streptomyces mashuensis]|uniref:Secreted protein n=1 Tax=Streptomyces mashuensis TaxID=33904 RepID=A0A919B1Q7_9ACTN|nr:hypothetical protein [Streptomyces mashuensis]GHF35082.1 hypothetical protein GCM10010218_15320 [Streptomyces mashuensis]
MKNGFRRAAVTTAVAVTALVTAAGQASATALSPGDVKGRSGTGCSTASGTYFAEQNGKYSPTTHKPLYDTRFHITVKDRCPGDRLHNAARLYLTYQAARGAVESHVEMKGVKTNGTYTARLNNVWDVYIQVCDWNNNLGPQKCGQVYWTG